MKLKLLLLCTALAWPLLTSAAPRIVLYDQYEVNGHPGYLSAWAVNGRLDKVLLIVPGFDISNDGLPLDELSDDLAPVVNHLGKSGWDVVYFEYVDGSIDLKQNADNLARFIEYLTSQAETDYHLAVIGGSMGGIVVRTMFVQEHDGMGVDSYVSIDSPHWGVYLSDWLGDVPELFVGGLAAAQMYHGHPAYEEHYGKLREVETTRLFRRQINKPMNTCAIALSDGRKAWKVKWSDLLLHNQYSPVSSYVEYSGLRSSYMPYHSTAYLEDYSLKKRDRVGHARFKYLNRKSQYFDRIIANPRDEHGAPEYSVQQALEFILAHGPED